jgi:hypothetical protein
LVVVQKHPDYQKQTIQEPNIDVLEAVNFIFLLCFAHSQKRLDFDIIINTIDIGIGMMDDIVLVNPHDHAGSESVYRVSGDVVPELMFAEAAVSSVMHHIETDSGCDSTHDQTLNDRDETGWSEKDEMYIKSDVQSPKQYCLEVKGEISCWGNLIFLKIMIDSFLQFLMKSGSNRVSEFWGY